MSSREWVDDMSAVDKALADGYELWVADSDITIDHKLKRVTIKPQPPLREVKDE